MFGEVKKEKKYFVVNLNSAEVSGALVYFDAESQMPMIEYSVREQVKIQSGDSADVFRSHTKQSIERVIDRLSNYVNISGGISNIEHAFVFLSPPWVRKNIHSIVDERIQSFVVGEMYLENFLENGGQIREDEDLLKAEIISLKANGYDVLLSDLVGKEVTRLDISLMDSYIDQDDKKMIEGVIKETFSFLDITHSAFLPVLFAQVKKLYDISDDFVFMDFTGEIMEFGIFQDGEIKNIVSFQAGKNKILREMVAAGVSQDFSDAEYTFSLYLQKNLDASVFEQVSEIIQNNIDYITAQVQADLEQYPNFHIPNKAFVVSAGPMNYLLRDLSLFKDTYFVGKSLIKNFVAASEDKYFDNFLALEAEYIFES